MSQLAPVVKNLSNGHQALAVRTDEKITPAEIVDVLKIPPCTSLMLISGGAGGMSNDAVSRLADLFTAVGKVIAERDVTVIDGGTQSGVMQLMGEALNRAGGNVIHIGVLPAYAEAGPEGIQAEDVLEPHHSRFVLVEGYIWGDEVETMYTLADYLSAKAPSITLLINGGAVSLHEVEWNVHQGREIIVLAGSGRLADEIAKAIRHPESNIRDRIAAVVRDGHLTIFDVESPPDELAQLLRQRLS